MLKSSGGGYVLSKAALKAFVEEINNPESHCLVKYDKGDEDWEMGRIDIEFLLRFRS